MLKSELQTPQQENEIDKISDHNMTIEIKDEVNLELEENI